MKCLCMITWLVTALAAIGVGLKPLGYNAFECPWLASMHPQAVFVMQYLIGAFGLLSLVMLVSSLSKGSCGCHSGN